MTESDTVMDRLRIERAVWSFDARLQDLPRRSRIAKRRELRQNLRAAAGEVGARRAVRQLGSLRALAAEYLDAEYGELRCRPSWTAAALWIAAIEGVMMLLDQVSSTAFRAGVSTAGAHPVGAVHWRGIPYLISDKTITYAHDESTAIGGAWTVWVYVLMLGGALVAGRIWRLVPGLRRRAFAHGVLSD
ncbi:MAG: hypothetical protein JWN95_1133 [Frankiales bacterium]|nr:hypothetical protein [Frankiales bacterium]